MGASSAIERARRHIGHEWSPSSTDAGRQVAAMESGGASRSRVAGSFESITAIAKVPLFRLPHRRAAGSRLLLVLHCEDYGSSRPGARAFGLGASGAAASHALPRAASALTEGMVL